MRLIGIKFGRFPQSLRQELQSMMRLTVVLILILGISIPALATAPDAPPTFLPAVERIIAIGDLHGDLDATRKVLLNVGIIDQHDSWIAGKLVVVQTGDQLDRGDQEQELLELLNKLQIEADQQGGAVYLLNGNHELMNARLDLRYVTPGGFADFESAVEMGKPDSLLLTFDSEKRSRVAAFRPGGPYALQLAQRNTIMMIGDNLFVHGGVLPEHLDFGLEELNRQIQRWLSGDGPAPEGIHTRTSPTWTRTYSDNPDTDSCIKLQEVLTRLGAARMIVGHTVQENGIAAYCDQKVWCIDSGISQYYGGATAVLEIVGQQVRVLGQ